MAVQLSTLPANLPPKSHLHLANFILPSPSGTDLMGVHRLLEEVTGQHIPHVHEEFGRRGQYSRYYTLRNEDGAVLITVCIGGANIYRDTIAVSVNGLCFETWSSKNPLVIDPQRLIQFVFDRKGWFTRLDVARNDYRRVINWTDVVACSHKNVYRDRIVTRLCRTKPPYYSRQDSESLYFGSSKSRTQILMYDKQGIEQTKFPWIRVELKARGKQQCNHIAQLLLDGMDIDRLSGGLMAYLLDFKEPVATDGTLTVYDKRNRPTLAWWSQFAGTEKIRLLPPKIKKEVDDELYDFSF